MAGSFLPSSRVDSDLCEDKNEERRLSWLRPKLHAGGQSINVLICICCESTAIRNASRNHEDHLGVIAISLIRAHLCGSNPCSSYTSPSWRSRAAEDDRKSRCA
jgi:hypothetical protein